MTSTSTSPTTPQISSRDRPEGAIEGAIAQERIDRAAWRAGMLGAVNFFTMILAARMIVLVAVTGGILLTWRSLEQPDLYRLVALATYCVAVVVPTVFLASRAK